MGEYFEALSISPNHRNEMESLSIGSYVAVKVCNQASSHYFSKLSWLVLLNGKNIYV
jgi:hypothetical protein